MAALHRRLKIAAVQQHHAITQANVLIGVMIAEDDKGIVLMAGRASGAANTLHAKAHRGAIQAALHQVMPIEGDKIQVRAGKIQTE